MNAEFTDSRVSTERRPMHSLHRSLATIALMVLTAHLVVACGGSDAETEQTQAGDRAQAYVFLSPSEVSVAPGQSIQVQVDIANLPINDAAFGYAISLSRETTRIDIATETNSPCASGTVSCRIWTITPRADAPPGEYAFSVRASGTRTPVSEADASIRVVAFATVKRAVISASAQHVVTADGRLWARGDNAAGQTGVGFESVGFDVNAPFVLPDFIDSFVQVGTDTDWSAVVSAGQAAIARKQDGTVWGWGANPEYSFAGASANPPGLYHQFVLPSARNLQLRPRQIPGLVDIVAISAIDLGEDGVRFLALTADGKLYGFGGGVDARYDMRVPNTLTFPSTDVPLLVPRVVQTDGRQTPLTGVRAIAGGVRNSGNGWAVALLDDGTVVQMGRRDSTFFRLDGGIQGVYPARGMPFAVAGLPVNVIAVTVGLGANSGTLYSLAAAQDGSVWSWTADDSVPQRVTGFNSPIVELDASGSEVTALDRTGGLWRWYFGATAPQRINGVPAMARLGHRGPAWSISADCASATRGALWSAAGQRVDSFGRAPGDDCASQELVQLSLSKVGSGTISIDPVDVPLGLLCGVDCNTTVSVPANRRDAIKVRATAAPGWYFSRFNDECINGAPLLEADTLCVATFIPQVLRGQLSVQAAGPGRITSTPAGIDCGADCRETYALGAVIQLTATPAPGYTLLRWSGPSNTNERDCRDGFVTMNVVGDSTDGFPLKTCIAIFGPLPRLSVAPKVGGTVTSTPAGINCGAVCTQPFAADTQITLNAVVNDGYRFDGFIEVECRGPITLTRDLNCTPMFTSTVTALLTVNVVGDGRVTSPDGNINCSRTAGTTSGICAYAYPVGTLVTLTQTPEPNWALSEWSSDCTGGTARLDVARVCTATFVLAGWQPVGPAIALATEQSLSIAVDLSVASDPKIVAANAVLTAGRVDLVVRRFEGGSWTLVGSGPINDGVPVSATLFKPAIAINAGGQVSVAWAENGGQVRVKQWTNGAWVSLADDLRVDINQQAFGIQITTAGSQVVVAWLETVGPVQGLGRMAVKRYSPFSGLWTGGSVLPTETGVTALRLTSEAAGNAMLMFVPYDVTAGSFEGPLRVLREGASGVWENVCGGLSRPVPGGATFPNTELGFGVAKLSFPASDPVAVFNNGDAVFALKCRANVWSGLDGSAQGQVATVVMGESLHALSVAEGEGSGVALAWTRVRNLVGGDREIVTQVMVENANSTALVDGPAAPFVSVNQGFARGYLSLTFEATGRPVLGGLIQDGGISASRVYRYVP